MTRWLTTCGWLAVWLALAPPACADFGEDRALRDRVARASVRLVAMQRVDAQRVSKSTGSGTIIAADGTILTNFHVIGNPENGKLREFVVVERLKGFQELPQATCIAIPQHAVVSRPRDLAVLRCEYDLDAKPYTPRDWPTIGLGDPDIGLGDRIWVLGYPALGGSTINLTSGLISGVVLDDSGKQRDWYKTDASINSGNSGGTAVDGSGRLIGVPSAVRIGGSHNDTPGMVGLVRPLDWAYDLITAAGVKLPSATAPAAKPPRLGIKLERDPAKAPRDGALVQQVQPGGPAEHAALAPGDVIIRIGAARVSSAGDVGRALTSHRAGEVVALTVVRNESELRREVRLAP